MARYLVFEKTRQYDYKFKGSSSGTNGNKAILNLRKNVRLNNKGIYIAIPTSQYMKYQLNPKSEKVVVRGVKVNRITWKKPR